ncbi:molybdopterin-dependent oxidoreductase [Candidatus Chloroploca sp. Khr17]|uniref:molybdopterin-containing oxidoreductase family protein n=1 Tax=Candidatus Chloroploca sp. Khr17 TaxID=2496869 RepID=UPI001F0D7AC3|nr:molybdopterin oxidoreductase family protein [Candidatus Chloroploca sp. Khr17]
MMTDEPVRFRGACPHDCPDTCATITEVQDGRAVRFYADPAHPVTRGWLCAKVRPYLERVTSDERLLYPLRRVGPKGAGQWQRISWDEALATIAVRWQALIAQYGAAAILPYSYSGTLGLVQTVMMDARLWGRMGASGLERAICSAAAHAAVMATLGARHSADYADVRQSKLVLIWGHNPASTGPHFMPFLREAQKAGTYVVVIDPRRTLTARSADEHLQPRPATDGALALGLMHVIFAEGLHDEAWLEAYSHGWRELRERARAYSPDHVAAITGIPAETIVNLARRYATTKPALLKTADGVQRHQNGGQIFRALLCLPALVGQYGVRGGGLGYSTGGYATWDAEALSHRSECPPVPRVINMNRLGAALTGEVTDPPIKSLFVYCANPVASSPNAGLIVEGLKREDLFTVVHEQFMTDTADYADLVLPATTQLEHTDLHRAYGHRYLQYNHAAVVPPGECKSNWDVSRLLAHAMGYTEPWLHESAEEALAGVLEASRATNPYLTGITLERLQQEGTVPLHFTEATDIPFGDLRFATPSGKVELASRLMEARGLDPLPYYEEPAEYVAARAYGATGGLILISGASHHFVSSSLANQPSLRAKEGEPFIEIHPSDAAQRQISDGAYVIVENQRGWCELRVRVTDDVPPGVAVAPKGPWAKFSRHQRNINWTTPDALADLAGQSTFHSNIVYVRPAS